MQRNDIGVKFTYAKTELVCGNIIADLATYEVHQIRDTEKALKIARKNGAHFEPLKTEKCGALWFLPDEIFYKYAKKIREYVFDENGNKIGYYDLTKDGTPFVEETAEETTEETAEENEA